MPLMPPATDALTPLKAPGQANVPRLALGLLLGSAAALSGCVSAPPPLQGEWPALAPRDTATTHLGLPVRWGGRLVRVDRDGNATCFELIAEPLAADGRPNGSGASLGPFRACRVGTYPADVFRPNRAVTFTGRIDALIESEAAGRTTQRPRVAADAVVLWP